LETRPVSVRHEKLMLLEGSSAEMAGILCVSYFGAKSAQGPVKPGSDVLDIARGIRVQYMDADVGQRL
jgi:hypothetical protein